MNSTKGSVIILIILMLLIGGYGFLSKQLEIKSAQVQEVPKLQQQLEEVKNENILLKKQVSRPIRDRIVAEIYKVFGSKAQEALAVAQCESGFNPDRVNHNSPGLGSDYNVFQVNTLWIKVFGTKFMNDYKENIRVAKAIFNRSKDWRMWKASNSCHRLANG